MFSASFHYLPISLSKARVVCLALLALLPAIHRKNGVFAVPRKKRLNPFVVWIAVLVIGMLGIANQAHAALSINSVTVNGGSSTTVALGANITVVVTNSGTTNWGSTGWYIGTSPPGTWQCDIGPSPSVSGNNQTYTFTITAPATAGTYNAYFKTSSSTSGCGATTSSTYTLTGGVIVVGPPTITSIVPNTGSTAGGTSVTITGTNFVTGATTVTIAGSTCTSPSVNSSTSMTCTTPSGSAGTASVLVTTAGGTNAANTLYTYVGPPTVISISPNTGPAAGGTAVTITGTGFISGATVKIGGTLATSVTWVSATSITATTPVGTAGAKDVVVTNPDTQSGTLTNGFTYGASPTVSSISPSSGPTAGGTSVTITGTNFVTGATAVTIAGSTCTSPSVSSSTSMTCTTPLGSAGTASVLVTTAGGTNAANTLYTYRAAPTVTAISPSSGPTAGSTSVTITGTNFVTGATTVTIAGSTCTSPSVSSSTSMTCTTPSGSAGAASVLVTTAGGTNAANTLYTYVAMPTVTAISPSSGPIAGGTSVTIGGTGFNSAATASIGGSACTVTGTTTATTLTCTTTTHAAGTVDVVVTNPDTQSGTLTNGFTYGASPTVSSISPNTGPTAGGTSVTITGTNFVTGATTVTIAGSTCTSPSVSSSTSMTCTTPSGSAGAASVLVTTAGGTNAANTLYTYVAMPTVTTTAATNTTPVNSWAKMLNGTVSANGASTTVYFEYGLTTLYGDSITADQSPLVWGASGVAVTQELDGLNCSSTFHYRAVAVNSAGLVNGADQSFATGSCIPPFPLTDCAAQRFGQNLGCTANDVHLTNIAVAITDPLQPTSCISGTPVTLDLDMTVNFGSPSRYDIGIFIANDGKAPDVLPTSGGASTCNVDVLPTVAVPPSTEVFPNLDGAGTGDTCGDGSGGLSKVHRMKQVTIPCYASPSSGGKLYVPYVVSWDNRASPVGSLCTSNLYPVPNTTSKCNAPGGTVSIDVVVLPKINKTHSGATFNSGDSITYSIVVFNDSGGTLLQSTLTDPAVPVGGGTPGPGTPGLVVGSIGCVAANGATCPSATIATGGHGINPVTIPSLNLPNNSSLTFTITGNLYGAIGETINNMATITIGTNSKTSTDSVTLGAASGGKSFAPSSITEGNNSVLTITFTNPAGMPNISNSIGFTDTYPSGLVNAASPATSTTCGGTVNASVTNQLGFAGGSLAPGASCTVSVTVTSATANSYVNSVTFSSGIVGSTSATLNVAAAVVGRFNACNVATAPNAACTATSTPYTSRLGTKLAGTPFNLDLVALNSNGSRNTSYANTVVVELLDASNNTGSLDAYNCRSLTWTTVIATASATMVSGDAGLKNVGPFTVANGYAYKDVRVRITQSGSTTIKGCSTDDFAIRPTGFTLDSVAANADKVSGANPTAMPIIKAGATFTLTATAVAVGAAATTGLYVGTPLINGSGITAHTGAVQTGNLTGTFGAAASGTATGSAFMYSEVGYLGFNPDAIYDDTFTAVDLPSDCTNDFSNTAVYGLFGCKFGNTATTYFGRFVPDHFTTVVTQGCSGGSFTYSGQPMTVAVTAYNSLPVPTVTHNYDGSATPIFAKDVTLSAWDAALGTSANPGPGALTPIQPPAIMLKTAFANGVGTANTPVYTFGAKLTAPTSIRLRGVDSDNVSSGSVEGTTEIRSGRARMLNAYGSERLDLPVVFRTEYLAALPNDWRINSADVCTDAALTFAPVGSATDITGKTCVLELGNNSGKGCSAALTATQTNRGYLEVGVTGTDSSGVAGFAGNFNLWLKAPSTGNTGSIDITATVPDWLQYNWTGTIGNPKARATFGIYKSPLIYRRENY